MGETNPLLRAGRTCRICGCTDHNACYNPKVGVCFWVSEDECSHCHAMGVENAQFAKALFAAVVICLAVGFVAGWFVHG